MFSGLLSHCLTSAANRVPWAKRALSAYLRQSRHVMTLIFQSSISKTGGHAALLLLERNVLTVEVRLHHFGRVPRILLRLSVGGLTHLRGGVAMKRD